MKTLIFKTYLEFLSREDKDLNGVSEQFALDNPDFENENETNKGCWNCSDCSDCYDCSGLRNSIESDENNDAGFKIPVIENIHQKVYEAASKEGALNMGEWHTCDTTHCRAGWAVFLAGEEGQRLENKTSTIFAAMQIFKASSDIRVYPPKFFIRASFK